MEAEDWRVCMCGKTPAIRRSGHPGTSYLDFWITLACWIVSIAETPSRVWKPQCKNFIDILGRKRWWKGLFEGPVIQKANDFYKAFTAFWDRSGRNMKLKLCSKMSELSWTHWKREHGDLVGEWCPDLLRCLKNCSIS